jgi:hypothetical protein
MKNEFCEAALREETIEDDGQSSGFIDDDISESSFHNRPQLKVKCFNLMQPMSLLNHNAGLFGAFSHVMDPCNLTKI